MNNAQKTFQLKDEIVIFVDSRELDSKVVDILKRKECVVKEKQLEIGDYLISSSTIIERKTSRDFVSSILDKRLFEQAGNLKEYNTPVILIEGKDFSDGNNVHPNAIKGALSSLILRYKIPILWMKNSLESGEMIYWLAKREQEEGGKEISIRSKKSKMNLKEKQQFLVSGLPGINTKLSKRLLKYFKTPEKIFSCSEEKLKEVEGIGEILSKRIKKILTEKYSEKRGNPS